MRGRGAVVFAVLVIAMMVGAQAAPAAKKQAPADPAGLALNILPHGQGGPNPTAQAQMYNALTGLFDGVSHADLLSNFKSEALGTGTDGPVTIEPIPYAGVRIERDKYNVPHVYSETYDGGVFAAGWIAAEDRGALIEQARYNGRAAAIDLPGVTAIGLILGGGSFEPSAQTEAQVATQTDALMAAGKEGRAVLRDIDTFIKGINAYLVQSGATVAPWTRNDVYSVNAVKDQFLGIGGGDEARRSEFLGGLRARLGARKGKKVFNDLRQFKNPRSITSVDGKFPYGQIPAKPKGSVVLDPGSFQATPAARGVATPRQYDEWNASNVLMVDRAHSTTGRPIMVGGPQIGYNNPGLTYEIDMHAPGLNWRGATSAPFPGYLLIGRGRNFATTLTSASGDVIDQYAETLCGGSDTSYLYKGKCLPMGTYDAGILNGNPAAVPDHGSRPGAGLRDGRGREGGDLREALQPQQGRARPALQPQAVHGPGEERQDLLQGGGEDAADLQLLLHRQQGDRRLHQRPASDQASRGGSRAAHEGHGQVRVERLPQVSRPSPGDRRQGRHDRQLEQRPGQGLRLPPTTSGAERLGGAQRPAHRQPEAPAQRSGQVVTGHHRLPP